MFGTTLVLPLLSGSLTLVKINQDGYSSEYRLGTSLMSVTAKIRHSKSGGTASKPAMDRHNFEVVRTTYATATVPEIVQKAYFVIEQSVNDVSFELMDAVADWAIATANSNLVSLIAWES